MTQTVEYLSRITICSSPNRRHHIRHVGYKHPLCDEYCLEMIFCLLFEANNGEIAHRLFLRSPCGYDCDRRAKVRLLGLDSEVVMMMTMLIRCSYSSR
jgi:hypothetical protein